MTVDMLTAALEYAALGWPVLPVHTPTNGGCSCGRSDCDQNGKHPRIAKWVANATTDADVISRWWQRWPDANIGIRTGVGCDLFDVDHVDYAEATATLETFEFVGPIARSGSGGWHFFTAPTGLGNSTKMHGLPLDWRGMNGYAIVPPSLHRTGNRYTWVASPHGHEVTPCPAQLRAFRESATGGKKGFPTVDVLDSIGNRNRNRRRGGFTLDAVGWNPAGLVAAVGNAPEGKRNAMLNWAALKVGNAVYKGDCTQAQADAALEELSRAARGVGLTSDEIVGVSGTAGTLYSGYNAGRSGVFPKQGRAA